jgi:MYXO-CTERM domain-containing protein
MSRSTLVALAALFTLAAATSASAQTYRRPVACDSCIANWYYYDQNRADGPIEDWNCRTSTYNQHRGSDFSLAGGNGAIDAGHDVIAAAAGTVVSVTDGFYDRCTSCPAAGADSRCGLGFGYGFGNHVIIQHGSERVVYAHMRMGSIRVTNGATVACGQVIGQIASSGCSTGAHLHFETRTSTSSTSAFDPFMGACSATSPSRWTSQGAYRSMPAPTCDGMTPPPTCPSGWYRIWTCNGTERRRCIDGMTMTESCAPGVCESRPTGTDDVCDADGDGYATDEGDCNDRNAAVNPGAREICGNGVDDDCGGGDMACPTDAAMPPPVDAAMPPPPVDAAVAPETDAALSLADAYVPLDVDAGPLPDAAQRPMDAGLPMNVDADAPTGGRIRGGCGCRATGAPGDGRLPAMLGLGLVGLVLARRGER